MFKFNVGKDMQKGMTMKSGGSREGMQHIYV